MALEELRSRIERDAEAEAERIDAEAEAAAERILSEARKAAAESKRRAREAAEDEAKSARKEELGALEAEADGMLSSARAEAVERQLGRFMAAVKRELGKREREIIKSAVREFSRSVPPERTVVRISAKNEGALGRSAAKVERASIRGVQVSSLDGTVSVDATVDGVAESNAELVRSALAGKLFR